MEHSSGFRFHPSLHHWIRTWNTHHGIGTLILKGILASSWNRNTHIKRIICNVGKKDRGLLLLLHWQKRSQPHPRHLDDFISLLLLLNSQRRSQPHPRHHQFIGGCCCSTLIKKGTPQNGSSLNDLLSCSKMSAIKTPFFQHGVFLSFQ